MSHPAPLASAAVALASRSVQLINQARAHAARCGAHALGPAPPVRLSAQLSEVAMGRAADMARHYYFEHEDPDSLSPADRVRASGYRETLVGQNIADVRFSEVGIAYAGGGGSRPGTYWVQVFAAPRT